MLLFWLLSSSICAQNTNRETIYIHTDRTVYIAGEKMYFKLYLLDAETQRRSEISKVGYVALRAANQQPTLKFRIKIDTGTASGSILLPDTLASGIYQIVAFTSLMKNYDERQFFQNEIVIVNGFDKEMHFKNSTATDKIKTDSIEKLLKINTNKKAYSPREKVVVQIEKSNLKANLSVSVFEDSNIPTNCNSITESLGKTKNQAITKLDSKHYSPEKKGKILRGKVFDQNSGQNISRATVLLSCIDTVANLQYAVTNQDGIFEMPLSDYYEGKELFITIRDMPANQRWKIEIEDEYTLSELWNPTLKYDIDSYKDFFTKSQNVAYINASYKTDEGTINGQPDNEKVICPKLYNCQVKPLFLSDYTPLNDFKEIVVELFPEVIRLSKENGKYRISVVNTSQKMFSDSEIAIFLDGVYVDDVDKIMKLGSEQIKKIDVLNTERVIGNLVYKGVISIISKSNEIEKTIPGSYSLRIKNDRIKSYDKYLVERPDTIFNKSFPFFRQLLYWNPNLEIKEQESTGFDFFTSDNEGSFILKIEGITEDGQPISFSKNIQVKKQPKSAEK
jgi:hypothetical protein